MALTEEWRHRIERWQKVLWELCYRPLGAVALSGFATMGHLAAEQARTRDFRPMPSGTRWGAKWEYGWFRGEVILPDDAAGQRIVLCLAPGGDSLVWLDGQIAGSTGWGHKEITLTHSAVPGTRYDLLLETYAGHGVVSVGEGPAPFGTPPMPEPGPTQTTVGASSFGVWLEDVYQLALDWTTLYELRGRLDPLSLRVAEIDQGLMDATLIVDPELPEAEMLKTVQAGRTRLKPLLDAVNGSTAPIFYAFGHAHIDVAWLWPLAQTERKMAATAVNQLNLMAEYPTYRFLQSQPHLYTLLAARYPDLYARFKAAAQAGQLILDGAMWVEADTNISGGEALIRQVTWGRRFFREEFGADSRVLWLPDVFGYSGALPQILRGCGCVGFATAKITWAYGGGDPFPYNTFWWEGIDGTAISAHIFRDYNSHTKPSALFDRWHGRLQKNGVSTMLLSFGWGDGGGGPERDHLEYLRRAADLEGAPRVRIASPAEFFADLAQAGLPRERYVGELYFQAHRGTYTSQARTKRGNRKAELALREAEFWGTAARSLNDFDFSSRTLDDAWRKVLLNQFHDILPGSSIQRVYAEAEQTHAEAIETATTTANAAATTFITASFDSIRHTTPDSAQDDSAGLLRAAECGQNVLERLTIFNSLSWPRSALVERSWGQAEVEVPACGWTTITDHAIRNTQHATRNTQHVARATERSLENDLLRVEFNERGEIVSLFDKASSREIMAGPGNQFRLYRDVPDVWDAWDVNSMTEQMPVSTDEPVTLELIENGPLVARLRLTRKLHDSSLAQVISLRRGSRRIEFATEVDWQERHKLLKVCFPVTIHADEAIHEIQFGHLRRPTHRSRPYDADRFEVPQQKWSALAEEGRGVALLNDCKYGISVTGNSLNLTLLKAALAPDPTADRGRQIFTYALVAWNGSLAESGVVREAYELNCPVMTISGAAGARSLFSLSAPNVVLETVKLAEACPEPGRRDGSEDVILLLYEAMRTATRCTLATSLPIESAAQTDLMEEGAVELSCDAGRIALDFRPFEIKTVRLRLSQ
ncbi:MAG: glycosyl hydrolase-related protein [Chloroflexi bacterium]|nr:glycosyl hydrolase-related protein [Chloroflexota bacterium]